MNLFVEHPIDTGLPNVGKSSFFNVLSETGVCKKYFDGERLMIFL